MTARYLRISLTNRCDFRCPYCLPARKGCASKELPFEDIVLVTRLLAQHGIRKVRLSGGEPLRRARVAVLLEEISRIPGIEDLGITTNGVLLGEFAPVLAKLGYRVNVHVDTLDPERYTLRMGGRDLRKVIRGIQEAVALGIRLKLNAVCSNGFLPEDATTLVRFAYNLGITVRFIEAMPVHGVHRSKNHSTAFDVIQARLQVEFGLKPVGLDGVAFVFQGHRGESVGFIRASDSTICANCDRLRLTADGALKTCLFGSSGTNLLPYLRSKNIKLLALALEHAIGKKKLMPGRRGAIITSMALVGG